MGISLKSSDRKNFMLCAAGIAANALAHDVPAQGRGPDGRYKPGLKKLTLEDAQCRNEPYLGRTCAECFLYQGSWVCVILETAVSPGGQCIQ